METKNKFLLLIIILIALGYLGTKEVLAADCGSVDNKNSFTVGQKTTITETEADENALKNFCQGTPPCSCPATADYHCEVAQNDKNNEIHEERWSCVSKSQPDPPDLPLCSEVDSKDKPFLGAYASEYESEKCSKLCAKDSIPPCYCPPTAKYSCELGYGGFGYGTGFYFEKWSCISEKRASPSYTFYTFETGIPGIAKKGETLPTSGISNLVNKIIVFVFALAGLLSMAMIIYAGVEISISAGNANLQRDAKDRLLWAIVGLIFLFTSYILLYTINPELVRIKEPGLEGNNNAPSNGFSPGGGGGGGGGGSGADGSGSGADGNNNAPHTLLTGFKWPLATPPSRDSITSCYGYRNSEELRNSCGTYHYCLCHQGIDILQDPNQPVYAVADGTVVDVGQGFTGLDCGPVRITIKHQGQGGTYYSIYCHLGSSSVSKDKQVKAGDQIGTTDNLGHLHIAFGSAPGYGDDTIRIDPACVFGTALTYGIEGVCMSSTPITDYGDCHFPPAGNCDLILGPKK